jgi:O-antigen chain-terminating methyltransferase
LGLPVYPLPFSRAEPAKPLLQHAIARVGDAPEPGRDNGQFYTYFSEMFENQSILEQQYNSYLPYIKAHPQPLLDIGCGAGEFLTFLKAHGIKAQGIDIDLNEVARAKSRGLDV